MRTTIGMLRSFVLREVHGGLDDSPIDADFNFRPELVPAADVDDLPEHLIDEPGTMLDTFGPVGAKNRSGEEPQALVHIAAQDPGEWGTNWRYLPPMRMTVRELRLRLMVGLLGEAQDDDGEGEKRRDRDDVDRHDNDADGPGRPRKDPDSPLAHYIDSHAESSTDIAGTFHLEPQTLDKYARGDGVPSLRTAKEIERKTHGAVPIDSWDVLSSLSSPERGENEEKMPKAPPENDPIPDISSWINNDPKLRSKFTPDRTVSRYNVTRWVAHEIKVISDEMRASLGFDLHEALVEMYDQHNEMGLYMVTNEVMKLVKPFVTREPVNLFVQCITKGVHTAVHELSEFGLMDGFTGGDDDDAANVDDDSKPMKETVIDSLIEKTSFLMWKQMSQLLIAHGREQHVSSPVRKRVRAEVMAVYDALDSIVDDILGELEQEISLLRSPTGRSTKKDQLTLSLAANSAIGERMMKGASDLTQGSDVLTYDEETTNELYNALVASFRELVPQWKPAADPSDPTAPAYVRFYEPSFNRREFDTWLEHEVLQHILDNDEVNVPPWENGQ